MSPPTSCRNLLDAAAAASDAEKVAAYDAVCANILEHAYQLPLVYQQTTITTSADLKGVEPSPLGVYMFRISILNKFPAGRNAP